MTRGYDILNRPLVRGLLLPLIFRMSHAVIFNPESVAGRRMDLDLGVTYVLRSIHWCLDNHCGESPESRYPPWLPAIPLVGTATRRTADTSA